MTKRQTLELELSELRQALNDLLAIESAKLTDEQRGELDAKTKRAQLAEVEYRAAIVADPGPTITEGAGDTQLDGLVARANLGSFFDAIIEHRATSGAEAELQQHFKLGGNMIPLAMLRNDQPGPGPREVRAVTPAPTDVGRGAR